MDTAKIAGRSRVKKICHLNRNYSYLQVTAAKRMGLFQRKNK
jgi:hypothetical protein